MKIELKLDESCTEPRIIIIAKEKTEEIFKIMEILSSNMPPGIVGFDGSSAILLDPTHIVRIYAAVGKVFAVTEKKEYTLHLRLYEVEEKLNRSSFVRISNSEIINIKRAKKFDLSIAGTICVSLSNGDVSFVSRRYVTKIKKTLGI